MEDTHVAHQPKGRDWLRDGERCFPIDSYSYDDREVLAKTFAGADPFPHLVLDDFLNLDTAAAEMFPGFEWDRWHRFGDDYQRQKVTCDDIEVIPDPFAMAIRESSEPSFLAFLEHVTGVPKLIPDPFLTGGGLHLSGP